MARTPKSLSLKSKTPKTAKPRKVLFADMKYMGEEPVWTFETATQIQLMKSYGWYNYYYQEGDNKKRFFTYLKNVGLDPKNYSTIEEIDIPQVVGSNCAMINRGCVLPSDVMDRFQKQIDALGLTALARESQNLEPKPVAKVRISKDTTIAELEELKDQALLGTLDKEWCSYTWASARKMSSLVANKVVAYYQPILDELKAATKRGADPELKEGYRSLSMMEVRRLEGFMSTLIQDMEKIKGAKNVARKPRKAKVKKAEVVVKALKYKAEDTTLKIASVPAEKLIGAKGVWLFDTLRRFLIKVESESLTVSGTTLGNITKSASKKIRKPETISDFSKLTRLQKIKAFTAIKAAEGENWSGRTNVDMLILAVEV